MSTVINGSSPSITFSDGTAQSTSARNGATVTSSAVDITLTSSSNQLQQVAMTAANMRVILPNATTYASGALGASIFVISNNGTYPFDIAETAGGRLFVLSPGQTTQISLSNNSASSTGWVATPVKSPVQWLGQTVGTTDLISYNPTDINSTAGLGVAFNTNNAEGGVYTMRCCALSSTAIVVIYTASTTYYPTAVAGTISGTTITWGTPVTVNAAAAGALGIAAMTSTTALMYYGGVLRGLAISGTTITVSAATASVGRVTCIYPLTSTVALFGYNDGGNAAVRCATYNGSSAPTLGTGVGLNAYTGTSIINPVVVVLSATSFVAYFWDDSEATAFKAGSVSGTTITLGTLVSSTNYIYPVAGIFGLALSATQALFIGYGGGAQILVTVSGTTVSTQTPITYNRQIGYVVSTSLTGNQNFGNIVDTVWGGYFITAAKLSSTDILIIGNGNANGINFGVQRAVVSATTLASGKGFSVTCNMPTTRDICPLTSTTAFLCGLRSDVGSPGTLYPTGQVVALNG